MRHRYMQPALRARLSRRDLFCAQRKRVVTYGLLATQMPFFFASSLNAYLTQGGAVSTSGRPRRGGGSNDSSDHATELPNLRLLEQLKDEMRKRLGGSH